MNIEQEINILKEKIMALEDENKKYRRIMEDTISNIDMDNMSSVMQKTIKTAGNNPKIELIAEGIGYFDALGVYHLDKAKIVAAVNDSGSNVLISADSIDLDGITRVNGNLYIGDSKSAAKQIVFNNGADITANSGGFMGLNCNGFNLNASGNVLLSFNPKIKTEMSGHSVNGIAVTTNQPIIGNAKNGQTMSLVMKDAELHFLVYDGPDEWDFIVKPDFSFKVV